MQITGPCHVTSTGAVVSNFHSTYHGAHEAVHLSVRNLFSYDGPRCCYKPDSNLHELYYRNVGLFNTNGRIVRNATIDHHRGRHDGGNSYFAFNFGGQIISVDKQVVFTFQDGNTHTVRLRDCQYPNGKQFW
ncbi:hypothetical protein I4U23_016119 [Adineta vaga]|nr:hypothetical protein I4U23_016119 [Adineta vaga]